MRDINISKKESADFLDSFYEEYPNEYIEVYDGLIAPSNELPRTEDMMIKLKATYPDPYKTILKNMDYYKTVHELLSQLSARPIGFEYHLQATHVIYFLYQIGEMCNFKNKTYERIVYIGQGSGKRLPSYARINWYPPLKVKIHRALAGQKKVSLDDVSAKEVDDYVKNNFTYRQLEVSSAKEAQLWERKIIPTIARNSSKFVGENWLGKLANVPYGIWNTVYAKDRQTLDDKSMGELSELILNQPP